MKTIILVAALLVMACSSKERVEQNTGPRTANAEIVSLNGIPSMETGSVVTYKSEVDTQVEILAMKAFEGLSDSTVNWIAENAESYADRGLARIDLYSRRVNANYENAKQKLGWPSVGRQHDLHRVQGIEAICRADTVISFGNIVRSNDKMSVELVDPYSAARTWGPFVGIALSDSDPRDNNRVRVFFYSETWADEPWQRYLKEMNNNGQLSCNSSS